MPPEQDDATPDGRPAWQVSGPAFWDFRRWDTHPWNVRNWKLEERRGVPVRPWLLWFIKRATPFVLAAGLLLLWVVMHPNDHLPSHRMAFWGCIGAIALLLTYEASHLWRDGAPGDGAVFALTALVGVPLAILTVAVTILAIAAPVIIAVALFEFASQ